MKKSILSGNADFLKLSRDIFKRDKSIRFQAKGWSMRPFILDGDFILISPVENSSLKTGDVVLYSTKRDKVIVHRIIKKYKKDGRMILLVKGDATSGHADEVGIQDVLGKVTAVERNGRKRGIDTKLYHMMGLLFAGMSPFSQWIYPIGSLVKSRGRMLLGGLLEKIQSPNFYSLLVKRLMKADINYRFAGPEDAPALSRLYRNSLELGLENAEDAFYNQPREFKSSDYWLVAKRKNRVIGGAALTEFPENNYPYTGWWVFGMKVNWRYRRMGVGKKLTKMAMDLAAEYGGSDIKLLVFEDTKPAKKLYKELGFRQISIPELDRQLSQEAEKTSRRRIILAKDIKSG